MRVILREAKLPRNSRGRQDDVAQGQLANLQINVMLFTVDEANRSWGLETLARNIAATSHLLTWADTGTLAEAIGDVRSFYRASFGASRWRLITANDRMMANTPTMAE